MPGKADLRNRVEHRELPPNDVNNPVDVGRTRETRETRTGENTGINNLDPELNPNAGRIEDGPSVRETNRNEGGINPIDIQNVGNGEAVIPEGSLNPTGATVKMTTPLKAVIKDANKALDLGVINEGFNPHRAITGDFEQPGQVYTAKCFVPTRDLLGAAIPEEQRAALAPLLEALPQASIYTSPAHQFAIDGPKKAPGNRVIFYAGDHGHKDIDAAVHEVAKKGMRLIKMMVHFDRDSQGGSPKDIVGDGVAGATHAGGFSAGFRDGKPVSSKSDWPDDYGHLDDNNRTYNAHLLAVDYQAGTREQVPADHLQAYKHNADMIDAFAGMVVPFASGDLDRRYTNYKFNPLEVHDNASAGAVMQDLASLDRDTLLKKHGAFYCAEGQYSVGSMGPKDNCLLKKSKFGETKIGKLIDAFQEAPGLERNAAGQITNPEVGWQHLVDAGLITEQQHRQLQNTDRTSTALEWVPEDIKGWENFGCKNKEGLLAEPMSVATMAWALIRTYMPREGMAKAMANDIVKTFREGGPEVQAGIQALLGGNSPMTEAGQVALGQLTMKAASGLLLKILGSDEFRDKLLHQAGFEEITNDADKQKVLDLYKKFIGTLQQVDLMDQAALDAAVKGIDAEFKALQVERNDFDPFTGETTGQRMSTMQYAAPQCFGFWAQQPDLFGSSGAIKYLATAQHADQEKAVG